MAATKKQSPAKAAAAKKAGKIPTPDPVSSTRASPRKASPAKTKKPTSPAKTITSPAKQAASSAKKAASPAKKSTSPAKKAASPPKKAASPARRAASPAKRAASPTKKATSPAKKVTTPDAAMRRSTRKTATASPSVTPIGSSSKPNKVTKNTKATPKTSKTAPKKRGLFDEDDDEDDSSKVLEEIVAEIGRRKLTKWDKLMIDLVQHLDNQSEGVLDIFKEELRLWEHGQPLNCHANLYWRFRHTFPDLADQAARGGPSAHQSIEQLDGPRTSPTKGPAAKRSPSKSPAKRSPSKSPAKSATRAYREVAPFTPAVRRSYPRPFPVQYGPDHRYRSLEEYDEITEVGDSYAKFMIAFEEESFERIMADYFATPDPPETLPIKFEDWGLAWAHACRRAERVWNTKKYGIPPRSLFRARMARTMTETETADILAQYANRVRGPSMFDSPGQTLGTGSKLSPGKSTKSTTFDLRRMDRALTSPAAPVKALAGARSPTASPGKQSSVRSTPVVPSRSAIKSTTKTTAAAQLPIPKQDPRRGPVISTTNPPYLPGTSKPNPFFETMPAPEVWNRRLPSFLTFGETPYMEQVISDQIDEDLAYNHDEDEESSTSSPRPEQTPAAAPTIMSRISSALLGRSVSASAVPEDSAPASTSTKKGKAKAKAGVHDRAMEVQPLRPTMWELPNLSPEEFRRFMDGMPSAPAALRREQVHVPKRKRSAEEHLGGGVAKKRARG